MYELTAPPQTTSPYTPAGGSNMASAPRLGAPVPGTTGGLPAQQGLSVTQNPAAQQLQSMGRGEDSVLVHMTPNEVNSLRGLANQFGGDLSINPQTGLPEAGWLGKLLPSILGAVGMAFGIPPIWMGLGGAAVGTAVTGDLGKGLSMGLQAYGGAALGGAAGIGGKLGHVGQSLGLSGSGAAVMNPAAAAATKASTGAATGLGNVTAPVFGGAITPATAVPQSLLTSAGGQAAKSGLGAAMSNFGQAAQAGLPGGIIGRAAPMLAASGVMGGVSDATAPKEVKYDPNKEKSNYKGPYVPSPRQVSYPNRQYDPENMDSSEHMFFTPSNPVPGYRPASELTQEERGEYGFAKGGRANIDDLASYFQSTSPGPITASMYPTQRAEPAATPATAGPAPTTAPVGEQGYNFGNTGTSAGTGLGAGFAGGIINIPGVGPIDLSKIMSQYAATTPASSTVPPSTTMPYNYAPYYGGGRGERNPTKLVAAGGKIDMGDGSFVVDARTVSELGNGSSNAGMDLLSRMGGQPVRGPGDGVSDSVPASIGGKQEARVARDEVIFPPAAVRRVGGGSEKRGTQKLYSLMDKAHKARKRAGRGTDTNLRRGLA